MLWISGMMVLLTHVSGNAKAELLECHAHRLEPCLMSLALTRANQTEENQAIISIRGFIAELRQHPGLSAQLSQHLSNQPERFPSKENQSHSAEMSVAAESRISYFTEQQLLYYDSLLRVQPKQSEPLKQRLLGAIAGYAPEIQVTQLSKLAILETLAGDFIAARASHKHAIHTSTQPASQLVMTWHILEQLTPLLKALMQQQVEAEYQDCPQQQSRQLQNLLKATNLQLNQVLQSVPLVHLQTQLYLLTAEYLAAISPCSQYAAFYEYQLLRLMAEQPENLFWQLGSELLRTSRLLHRNANI